MAKKKVKTDRTKPRGMSKYAKKIARRRQICRRNNLPDTPKPVLREMGLIQ